MSSVSKAIRDLVGARVRLVWIQQQEDHTDFVGLTPDFKLMALDTDDGQGEREVFDRIGSYCAPVISPNGDRILYTDITNPTVHIVDWDGSNDRVLGPGFCCGVWKDSKTGQEWTYIRPESIASWNSKSRPVMAHLIDDPSVSKLMWDKSNVSRNWFQLSQDGTRAAAAAPWPQCGMMTLPNGEFTLVDKGCWTAMTPDNTYRMWVFDGDHRRVKVYDQAGTKLSTIDIHQAEGIQGYEVYFPRLGSDGRVMTMTGPFSGGSSEPCPDGDTENRIREGGRNIELYVGVLDAELTKVEGWVKVTDNDNADFFGDAWVERA